MILGGIGVEFVLIATAVFLLLVMVHPEGVALVCSRAVTVIGWMVGVPAWICGEIAKGAKKALEATLQVGNAGSDGTWGGLIIAARILYGVIAFGVLLGVTALDFIRSPLILAGLESSTNFLPVPLALGILWVSLSLFWGCLWLDAFDAVPRAVQLFSNPSKLFRVLMKIVTSVGVVLTMAAVSLLFVASQLILQGFTWGAASVLLSAIQGLLVALVGIPGLWALVLGVIGVCSLVLVVCWLVFAALRLPFFALEQGVRLIADEIIPHLVYVLAAPLRFLYNGVVRLPGISWLRLPRLSRLDSYEAFESGVIPPLSGGNAAGAFGSAGSGGSLGPHPGGTSGRITYDVPPDEESEDLVLADSASRYKTSILAVGDAGRTFMPTLVTAINDQKGASAIANTGTCPYHRLTDVPVALGGPRDISIVEADVQEALARRHDSDDVTRILLRRAVGKFIERTPPSTNEHGQLFLVTDLRAMWLLEDALGEVSAHLPNYEVVAIAVVPKRDQYDGELRRSIAASRRMHQQRKLTSVILKDPDSRLALRPGVGALGLDRKLATGLASVLVAHAQSRENLTYGDMAKRQGARSCFVGVGLSSGSVVAGRAPRGWGMLRGIGAPKRGASDPADVRNTAIAVTDRVIADEATHTVDLAVDQNQRPLFLVYTLPMKRSDGRWETVCEQIDNSVRSRYPGVQCIFISGSGTPDEQISGPYYLQVSCFYGLPSPLPWEQSGPAFGRRGDLERDGLRGTESDETSAWDELGRSTPVARRGRGRPPKQPQPIRPVRRLPAPQMIEAYGDADEPEAGVYAVETDRMDAPAAPPRRRTQRSPRRGASRGQRLRSDMAEAENETEAEA